MTLGDIVKNYRAEHGLSLREFSRISGVSNGYISMLEKNEHPKTKNLSFLLLRKCVVSLTLWECRLIRFWI